MVFNTQVKKHNLVIHTSIPTPDDNTHNLGKHDPIPAPDEDIHNQGINAPIQAPDEDMHNLGMHASLPTLDEDAYNLVIARIPKPDEDTQRRKPRSSVPDDFRCAYS